MKIQIALVSKETLPVFYMINEFLPDVVYLVGTAQTAEEMDNIEKAAQKINVRCEKRVTKPDDMKDSYNVCEGIVTENGADNEYCFNLTCGTKLMAFSALVCAQAHKAKVVYSDTAFYTDFDSMERKPITRMLDIDTIIALQGQKVKEKVVYQYDAARTECAQEIQDFISCHLETYRTLAKCYQRSGGDLDSFSRGDVSFRSKNGSVIVEKRGVVLFSSDYSDAYKMLFSGRWWEDLVADAVHEWAGEGSEVWTSVHFEPKNNAQTSRDKNEIDVLVNIGNILLFVECKSGAFSQESIYKLGSVCKTYGSYKSKGVIVSFRDSEITPDLLEKAKEERVELIAPVSKKTGKINLANKLNHTRKVLKS